MGDAEVPSKVIVPVVAVVVCRLVVVIIFLEFLREARQFPQGRSNRFCKMEGKFLNECWLLVFCDAIISLTDAQH